MDEVLEMVGLLLNKLGYQVLQARDGIEAVVMKPFKVAEFRHKISEAMGSRDQ